MNPDLNVQALARSLWDEFERINFGDKRRVPPNFGNMQVEVFALDNAREAQEFRVHGDFLFVDADSTGKMYVQINGSTMPKFPFSSSTGIQGFPYRTLSISNTAQAGKIVRLWHGYGAQIIPPNQDIANIGTLGSITTPVNLNPEDARYFLYGDDETMDGEVFRSGHFNSAVAGAVGLVEVFNPAASGVIVYIDRMHYFGLTANTRFELYHHNAAVTALVRQGINQSIGGAAGIGAMHGGTTAAARPGTLIDNSLAALLYAKNELIFNPPFRLAAGRSLYVSDLVVNQQMAASFSWREKLT